MDYIKRLFSTIKPIIKDFVPPILIRVAQRLLRRKGIYFEGNYKTWKEAALLCTGYDDDDELILQKVLDATLKVKHGQAAFERDSVIFDQIQYSWPVTAALMWAAARNKGKLHVLDFGGSLGSSYFQNKKFLTYLEELSWSIIEQSHFVEVGNKLIADDFLRFYETINACYALGKPKPNVALLSGVLQYLENPYDILLELSIKNIDLIILDRTPFANDSITKIKIQYVPPEIYSASYPCWFFNRQELIQKMDNLNYRLVERFDAIDKPSNEAKWEGMIFERVTS